MFTDDVDDGRARAPCVVEIGQAISKTGTKMQKGARRLFRHPCIAIGSTGDHAFEQSENCPHARLAVERCDKVHLRGAGVAETHLDTGIHERRQQALCTIHRHCVHP